ELAVLRERLSSRQTELESHYSEFANLGEALGAQIRALEEQILDKLEVVRTAQREMHHFKSEAQSLAQRVIHSESASWQSRTLAMRTAEQLEQSTETLRDEIAALKAALADFNDPKRNQRLTNTVLKEVAQNVGAKFEEILGRLGEQHHTQLGYDARLGNLDSGLSKLAERMAKTESLWRETHAQTQAEGNSASDFRRNTAQELATLHAKVREPQGYETAIRDLESSLRAGAEEWQQQAAQKFLLLGNQSIERDRTARELTAALGAKLVEQEARTEEKLCALASNHTELLRLRPEIQTLGQRIAEAESAAQRAQAQAGGTATRTGRLEESVKSDIAAVQAELARLAEQQHAFRLPEELVCEIECKLDAKLEELQQQLAVEREGFDHWGNGLRESFGSELSAIQARLSDRQSQIEHRYGRLELWEETVKTNIERLEAQFEEITQTQEHNHEEWRKLQSEVGALSGQTSQLESRALQTEDRVAVISQHNQHSVDALRAEISAVATLIDQRPLSSDDSIMGALEETLSAGLAKLDEQLTRKFTLCDNRDSERVRQAEQTLIGLKNELELLKTALDNKQTDLTSTHALSPGLEDSLRAEIRQIDEKLAERFTQIDTRDAERARETCESIETLQSKFAAIKSVIDERSTVLADSSVHVLEASLDNRIQELQQQVAQQAAGSEKRYAERTRQAERTIADLATEVASLKADRGHRPIANIPLDPALRDLEEQLGTKIQELRQETAQKFSAFDGRDSEIKELKERSQSLIQRVTQLSAAVQFAHNTPPTVVQPVAAGPEASVPRTPPANSEDDSPAETKARSEKEQLVKLQERMSSEIERVRAELKERSGRWKVRKSAS
ncbi:MAG: hypothetical protein ACREQV_02555, partial [Candidatus Binatia bacterium]